MIRLGGVDSSCFKTKTGNFSSKTVVMSALALFEMFFLQPVLGSDPVLSGHLAIPRG